MTGLLKRFLRDQTGATAIEYGLIVALLSMVVCGAITALGGQLYNIMGKVNNALTH